jgi:hypothetical protein
MSGHPKSDKPNPKEHLEHPGPESPAQKGSSHQSSSSPSSTPSKSSSKPSNTSDTSSSGGHPRINKSATPPEDANEEVRKHNEDMAKRHDQPVSEAKADEKVDKEFISDR